MSSVLTSILSFIVAISVLVAVHEYGHYIVGRMLGMKVLRFSIGFGKPFLMRIGGKDKTEYCLSAIPLGGYVRFLDSREGPVAAEDEGRAFDQRPIHARIAVLLAGPAFNFLFAIVAYWLLFMDGVPALRPVVGEVLPQSYAAAAGLVEGEQIVRIGDREILSWNGAVINVLDHLVSENRIPMTLEDDSGRRRSVVLEIPADDAASLTEPGRQFFDRLGFGIGRYPAIVGHFEEGGAAFVAGLEDGDKIVAIDDTVIRDFRDLIEIVRSKPGEQVQIAYVRDQSRRSTFAELGQVEEDGEQVGRLGAWRLYDNIGIGKSFVSALGQTWEKSRFTVQMLGRMLTGDVSIKNISGPINIAKYAGQSARLGFRVFVDFLILISISLGILNLLPIPVLDGGQIVFQLAEWIKGSPVTERVQLLGQQVGILALLLLMSFAIYNDITGNLG